MIDIKKLISTWFFKETELKESETLFDEWDIDNNLYVIVAGSISIQKYTDSTKKETKELATLSAWEIFWEGSLSNSDPKEVKIVAISNTKLLILNAKKDFTEFLKNYPKEAISLLANIIDFSNKRLLESNFLLTSTYSLIKYISWISEFDNKNLFLIIDRFLKILNSEFIIYIEKSPVVEETYILRYNTREKWKMQEQVWRIKEEFDSEEFWLWEQKNLFVEDLRIWNEVIWYLLIWWKEEFSETQIKSIWTVSVAIAWFVKQKQIHEENVDSEYFEI